MTALALPAVEAFDLAIPAQVFGDHRQAARYRFTVCSPAPGLVASTTGYAVHAEHDLRALAAADTVVVPGCLPLEDPGEEVGAALRQAAARGARVVSVCTGAFVLAAAGLLDGRRAATHWHYPAPLRWVTAARVREARRLLEASDLPVEDVAARTGRGQSALADTRHAGHRQNTDEAGQSCCSSPTGA